MTEIIEKVEFPTIENAENYVPSREQIEKLQSTMVGMPQAELETEHYFSGGMYCRKLIRPAGTLIVGKVHKKDHFFMCAQGEIIAWSEKGMVKLKAGDIIESKAGTKRVTLALSDAIGITFHKTDKTDLDEIEAELIEPDNLALYDAHNKLKDSEMIQKILGSQKCLG
jgi:mannose-6-phosphate isomerase-like protein (cupin superfamily)